MAEAQVAPLSFNPAELIKRVEDTEKRLQTKDAEIQVYKMLMSQMEEELAQAKKLKSMHDKQAQDVDSIKMESEKTLTKAKSLIFERTKVIKNQELQIEAFVQQIESLKEVVRITKDLLEIRNLEIKQLENKIYAIEGKMKCEHERYDLMHKKLEQMIRHNGELKREYETQLCLFSALRQRYNERELAKDVVDDLKEGIAEEKNKTDEESRSIVQADEQNDESLRSEQPPANQVKNDQTDDSTSSDDKTLTTVVENTDSTKEEVQTNHNDSALTGAKKGIDHLETVLSVLENTLGLENSTPIIEDQKDKQIQPDKSSASEKTNVLTEACKVQEETNKVPTQTDVTVVAQENNNDIHEDVSLVEESNSQDKTEENNSKPESTSTLTSIISAIKNTVGLGSDPLPEKTQTDEVKAIPTNLIDTPQNTEQTK